MGAVKLRWKHFSDFVHKNTIICWTSAGLYTNYVISSRYSKQHAPPLPTTKAEIIEMGLTMMHFAKLHDNTTQSTTVRFVECGRYNQIRNSEMSTTDGTRAMDKCNVQ